MSRYDAVGGFFNPYRCGFGGTIFHNKPCDLCGREMGAGCVVSQVQGTPEWGELYRRELAAAQKERG